MTAGNFEVADLGAILGTAAPKGEVRTPLHCAVEILCVLRDNAVLYRRERHPRMPEQDRTAKRLEDQVKDALGEGPKIAHDEAGLQTLQTALATAESDRFTPLLLARLTARAIEQAYVASFWRQLKMYYDINDGGVSRVVQPGDPIPTCNTIFGRKGAQREGPGRRGEFGTNPRNLPRWRTPDRLARILLAPPSVAKAEVVLDFSLETELERLQAETYRVATVHSANSLEDIHYESEGDYLSDVYFHFGKRHPFPRRSTYRRFLTQALDVAASHKAQLVVLPELSVSEEDQTAVLERWRQSVVNASKDADKGIGAPMILVAGSRHARVEELSNVATIAGHDLSGAPTSVVRVEKSVPYVHRVKGRPNAKDAREHEDRELVEDIVQHDKPHLTLMCSESLTMLVLICMDFLLDGLRDLARDLDVSLLVVPSMSVKSQVYHGLIDGHVAATQSSVVFANTLLSTDEKSRGYVAHPSPRRSKLITPKWRKAVADGPGVAIIDLDTPGDSEWISASEVLANKRSSGGGGG